MTLSGAGIERLHTAAAEHVGDERVPGLVALVASGTELHLEAPGSPDRTEADLRSE
jgi:hypothetical protein